MRRTPLSLVRTDYSDDDESHAEEIESRQPIGGGFIWHRAKPIDDYRPKHAHGIRYRIKAKPFRSTIASMAVDIQIQLVLDKLQSEAGEFLNLPDDWDGEGTLQIQQETVDRALKIVRGALESADIEKLPRLLEPDLTPLTNGSIDVYWKSETFTLLINVPRESREVAKFYGSNLGTEYDVRGRIRMDALNLRFLDWLVE